MRIFKKLCVLLIVTPVILTAFTSCDIFSSTYKLAFTSNPSGAGTFKPTADSYAKGLVIPVQAIPNHGYRFDHWAGGASGSSPNVQITMDKSKNLVAYFIKTYMLSATCSPSNGGTISPSDGTYDEGSSVTLIASSGQYYQFNGWAGDVSGSSDHLTVTINSNKNIIASYKQQQFSLQTNVNIPNSGTIQPGTGNFEAGTTLQVTEVPAEGYRFDHWGGGANSTTNTLSLMMDNNKTLTAYFVKVYTLTEVISPTGSGSISPGNGVYDSGSAVTLTAGSPVFPYAFDHWSGADNNTNPTTITMNSDKSVTASFIQLTANPQFTTGGQHIWNGNAIIPIKVNQNAWVDGNVDCGTFPQVHAYIQGPDGKTIKDFGNIGQASFRFVAPAAGTYNVVVESNFVYGANYNVTYTIYGK